jgi:hypothetical protein
MAASSFLFRKVFNLSKTLVTGDGNVWEKSNLNL